MRKYGKRLLCLGLTAAMMLSVLFTFGCAGGTPEDTSDQVSETAGDTSAESAGSIRMSDLALYSVVRPDGRESLTDTSVSLYTALNALVKDSGGKVAIKTDFYKEGVPAFSIGEYEILIGKTNRPESAEFISKLRYKDYGYTLVGRKLVIAGGSDEATALAVSRFMSKVVKAANPEDEMFFVMPDSEFLQQGNYLIDRLSLCGTPVQSYRIIYPSDSTGGEEAAARNIMEAIRSASGYELDVQSDRDAGAATGREILVGKTDRTAKEPATLVKDEAYICYDGKNITLYAADSAGYGAAFVRFTQLIGDKKTEEVNVVLSAKETVTYDSSLLTSMSFNLWVSSVTEDRVRRVITIINNYSPDTIGFQEASPNWMSILRSNLGRTYAYVGEGRDGGSSGEHNPIFYRADRFKLLDSGTRWLSDTPSVKSKYAESSLNRIYTFALLERISDGRKMMVVNTHFDHKSGEARQKQAKVLVEFLKTQFGYPVILTGDFNGSASSAEYSTIINSGMTNSMNIAATAEAAPTFTSYGSASSTIDFIFVIRNKTEVSFYRVCNEMIDGNWPSDHHPVIIKYTLAG